MNRTENTPHTVGEHVVNVGPIFVLAISEMFNSGVALAASIGQFKLWIMSSSSSSSGMNPIFGS